MALDIPSYLLGKSKGGGGEPPVLINKNITANGTYNASDDNANGYSKVNVNVEADVSEYLKNEIGSNSTTTSSNVRALSLIKKLPQLTNIGNKLDYAFYRCVNLEELPMMDTSNVTTFREFAPGCSKITTIPAYNTHLVTNFSNAFGSCTALVNVPILDFYSAVNLYSVFNGCYNLSDTSLDNILQSCIGAHDYTGRKTLQELGFNSSNYPASRIQALPHYQDFIDAGWTIGY